MQDFSQFKFDPRMLSSPRKPGISVYMRIKNEEEFVRAAILSHLDFYDEIIAVYNGCTDNTEAILLELQKQHPQKIKVYHYLPIVHPLDSEAHNQTSTESVHSMANYSNYTLSKTTYSVAAKLDADHLAIPQNLAPLITTIRRDIAAGRQKIYTASGINLIEKSGQIMCGGRIQYPFAGQGDYLYHPVNETWTYRQGEKYEYFTKARERIIEKEYMGIMFFHLKYLKKNLATMPKDNELYAMPFEEFCSAQNHTRLVRQLVLKNRLRYILQRHQMIRRWMWKLTRRHPTLKVSRMIRLADDLKGIDFKRDVLERLESYGYNRHGRARTQSIGRR